MKKLHRESDTRSQPCNSFINELKIFHHNKGTPFRHLPRINGQEVDLLKLYNQVTALGGLQKVNDQQKWNVVADNLKLPNACANFTLALRQLYTRYLGNYEKIHFMTQESNIINQSAEFHPRKQKNFLHSVPLSYNHIQHEVSDSSRIAAGLNQIFCNPTDYDKLCLSLLSGLPNEQKLALNVCTILANECNYMLQLENCPKLVNFLLTQAGIWPLDDDLLKEVFFESWAGLEGWNMKRFWCSALNRHNPKISNLCNWILGDEDTDNEFLNLELDLGALNIEGQRVKSIALIFYNLSFEKNNVLVLASNPTFLRFAVLCMHTEWAELKQIAYDTVSNIASAIQFSVEKNLCMQILFQTIVEGIQSPDRFLVVMSLDIFSKLCLCETNKDIIASKIDIVVYEKMVSFLTIHDILLLFFTLEALYELSSLGRYACEKIVGIHRSIGILVNLLTIDPNEYGPSAHIGMKLVETMKPVESDTELKDAAISTTSSKSFTSSIRTSTSAADSKTLACNWLRLNYEYNKRNSVSGKEVYADYIHYCGKNRHETIDANLFENCVGNVFSKYRLIKVISSNGITSVCYDGLQKKKNFSLVHPTLANSATMYTTSIPEVPLYTAVNQNSMSPKIAQEPIHSSSLKVRLSTPHPSSTNTLYLNGLAQQSIPVSDAVQSCQSISPNTSTIVQINTPHTGSTLIRNSLINEMQQNLQQPHSTARKVSICNLKQLEDGISKSVTEPVATLSMVHLKSVQDCIAIEKNVTDSNDSVFSDDGSMNSFSNDSKKMSILPPDAVSLNNDNLSTCSSTALTSEIKQSNSITTQSNFLSHTEFFNSEEICKPKTSTITSILPMPVTVVQSVIQPKSSCSSLSLFKSLLGELDHKAEENGGSLFKKNEICEKAPLLNELLNRCKVPVSKDLPLFQNENKAISYSTEMDSEHVLDASATVSPATPNAKSFKKVNRSWASLFGAVEVETNEEGVVRLHIESPEKSNQSTDLSSTSDILERTSAITSAKCNSQFPFSGKYETATIMIPKNVSTSSRLEPNQQINGFLSALNQSQVHNQPSNANALCSKLDVEDSVNQQVSLNQHDQICQPIVESPIITSVTNTKRPFDDSQKLVPLSETHKPFSDAQFSLLKAILKCPAPVSSFASTNDVSIKPLAKNHSLLNKQTTTIVNPCHTSKSTASESVPVQDADIPSESKAETSSPLSARNHSTITTNILSSTSPKLEYLCEWKNCGNAFQSSDALFVHIKEMHAPFSKGNMICLWKGCQLVKRRYFLHLTHLEWHCSEIVSKIQALPQKQITQLGETTTASFPNPSSSDLEPNAALRIIRRHSLHNSIFEGLSNEKESALTKSLRLTSALILRNLVSHSSVARSSLRCYEPELVCLAMSPVESSTTIAQCLSELGPHG